MDLVNQALAEIEPPVAAERSASSVVSAPPTPIESRLAMPAQNLFKFDSRQRRRLAAPQLAITPWLSRLVAFGGGAALTVYGGLEMYKVIDVGGVTTLKWALLGLFVLNFSWIALSFSSSIVGAAMLLRRRPPSVAPSQLSARTAVVMPIYNETPSRVFAALQVIFEDVETTGLGENFDWFFLSDTTNPDIWIAEERAFIGVRRRLGALGARVFYRRREKNTSRKAGNIADFVSRWGGAYAHMVVLDADSLMTGATIVQLAAAMEADPDSGIIQTLPLIINRNTLFARVQQFAARIYGPVIAAGLSAWMGRDGNYWGHNAIIRTEAFARYCGLPDLRGRPPWGGHILSHDFVEAALMRRAGYAVYMLPTLGGSYEESPPSLIDLSIRDRRWCQGNLQHIRVLFGRGFHWATRQHFLTGIFGYLTSPLWLLQLLVGIALVFQASYFRPEYFTSEFTLFPVWPRFDAERSLAAVRTHDGHSARAEAVRAHRRDPRSGHAPRVRRRRGLARLDIVRSGALGPARADHDADSDRSCRAYRIRFRYGLGPATTRRRFGALRRDRAASPLACGPGRSLAGRGPADFPVAGGLDVANHRRPHSGDPHLLVDQPALAGTGFSPRWPAGDSGGDDDAARRQARQGAIESARARWGGRDERASRHSRRPGVARTARRRGCPRAGRVSAARSPPTAPSPRRSSRTPKRSRTPCNGSIAAKGLSRSATAR